MLLIFGPFDHFPSEYGKPCSSKEVRGTNLIKNFFTTARSSGINVVYITHHQTEKPNPRNLNMSNQHHIIKNYVTTSLLEYL